VCTGSIYLAAAGILDGQRPALTGHAPNSWNAAVPATPGSGWWNAGKVITAAGVSAGIDTALTLLARAHGPQLAQMVQLAVEYDPRPPLDAGSPSKAPAQMVDYVRSFSPRRCARSTGRALGRPR